MAKGKQRQKIRKTVLYIFVLLFPIVYYYLSPYLVITGASEGIVTGSLVVFSLMLFTSLFLGRAFCGWVCPAGGEQDLCSKLREGRFRHGKLNVIKYIIWLPWVSIIGLMFFRAGGIKSLDFLYQTYYGVSIQNVPSLVLFSIIAGIIALLALSVGKRGFCHLGCWMAPFMIIGRKLSNLLKFPALRLRAYAGECIECKACTDNCPMSLDVMEMVRQGYMEDSECILCGTCVDICPGSAIKYSFSVARIEKPSTGPVNS